MNASNDGGPAFPQIKEATTDFPGMDLRDYFAAAALKGLLANPNWGSPNPSIDSRQAFAEADAMLAQRSKTSQPPLVKPHTTD